MENLLGEGGGAALEAHLQATKWDLALNPARFASWERLAAGYHFAADSLLVRTAVHPGWVGYLVVHPSLPIMFAATATAERGPPGWIADVAQAEASESMSHVEWRYSNESQHRWWTLNVFGVML